MSSNRKTANSNSKPSSVINIEAIHGSNTLLKIFSCLIIIVVICLLIGNYAFKNGALTCSHYEFNTYLYIILAILLIFLVVLLNDQFGFFTGILMWIMSGGLITSIIFFIVILALIIGLTYLLKKTDPKNLVASNGIWLALIFLLGLFIIPIMWLGRAFGIIGIAGLLTILITIIVGLLGYYYGDKIITFNWDLYLSIALVIMIIVSIAGQFLITNPQDYNTFIYVTSIIFIIIFTLLLLSSHKKLKENSEKCIDGQMVPNYPLESFSIVIKIYNIFTNIISALASRKLRK